MSSKKTTKQELERKIQRESALQQEPTYVSAVLRTVAALVTVLDPKGRIVSFNRACEEITGYSFAEVEGRCFWDFLLTTDEIESVKTVFGQLRAGQFPNEHENYWIAKDGTRYLIHWTNSCLTDSSGAVEHVIGTGIEVTEQRRARKEREVTIEFLGLMNTSANTRQLVETSVRFFHQQSGCEAVGIRLRDGDDYPYYEAHGFPEEFLKLENSLCVREANGAVQLDHAGEPVMACMCGNVICGRFDPRKPFFTPAGSFWANDTTRLLAMTADADRQTPTRNRCNGEGYESVTLIALQSGKERLGLLQLNDRRKGMFTPEIIALWERLAGYLGVALAKARAEEEVQKLLLTIREEKERLSCLLNGITDEVWFADTDRKFTLANPSAIQEFRLNSPDGTDVGELAANLEVYRGDGSPRPVTDAPPLRALAGEVIRNEEEIVRTPGTGELQHRQVSSAPVRDAKGHIIGSISVVRNITDQKRAEEELRKSRAKLEAAFASMTEAIFIADAEGRLTDFNDEFIRYHRFKDRTDCSKMIAECPIYLDAYFQDGTPAPLEMWAMPRALRGETGSNFEYMLRRKDTGETWWGSYSFGPIKDKNGRIAGAIVAAREITDRKRADEAFRRSQRTFAELVERAPFGIYVVDSQFCIAQMNAGSQNGAFRNVRPLIGRDFAEAMRILWPESVAAEIIAVFRHTLETGEPYYSPRFTNPRHDVADVESYEWELHRITLPDDRYGVICYYFDSTKLRQAEETIRQQADMLRLSFDAIIVWRLDGGIETWNRGAEQLYGFTSDEAIGHGTHDLLQTVFPIPLPEIEAILKDRGIWEGELRHRTKDVREVIVSTRLQLIRGGDGIARVLEINRDITARKQAEEAMQKNEEEFRAFVTASSDAVYQMSADWSEMRQLHGRAFIPDTDSPSRAWLHKYIYTDDQPRVLAVIDQAIRTKSIFELEHRVRRVDGSLGWTFSRAVPLLDANGEIVEWFGAASDITESKHTEEALRESERMYRAIGESIDYGVWICDPEGRNIYASDSFLKLVGITQQQCSDFGWGDVLHPDDIERTIAAWKECVRAGGTWDIEHRFRGVDGEWHPILARGVPVRNEQGQIVRWAGINLDIGRLKRTEEALKTSLGEKEILLKEIHHRVKNNMQVISSLVSLQANQLSDDAMRAILQELTHRVRSMALVHEKLYQSADMARVEFAEYAQTLLNYLWRAHGAAASGMRLVLNLEPVQLSVDAAVPCGLILNELATNALKHAFRGRDGGEVSVSLRVGPEGKVCLRVRDNGTGLPAGFDWRQAKSLGLHLVQILAKQLSATVEVSSGEGAEFSVSFGGPNL